MIHLLLIVGPPRAKQHQWTVPILAITMSFNVNNCNTGVHSFRNGRWWTTTTQKLPYVGQVRSFYSPAVSFNLSVLHCMVWGYILPLSFFSLSQSLAEIHPSQHMASHSKHMILNSFIYRLPFGALLFSRRTNNYTVWFLWVEDRVRVTYLLF